MNKMNYSTVWEFLELVPSLLSEEIPDVKYDILLELLKTSDRENVKVIYRELANENSWVSRAGRQALLSALRTDSARRRNEFPEDDSC